MKLFKLATAMLAVTLAFGVAGAKKMSDLKIYINPGHGGYTSNDRPIRIYPFEQNDSNGYWESKSNLYKGLHMYHILDSLGAKPKISRIKNTEADDRSLSGIAAEANQFGADLFFSIHSNAGENVNYPLMLYRENTIGTPRYPGNVTLSHILWQTLHSNQLPYWTLNEEYIEGDLTFYRNMWEGGLGVLRPLYVVGLLSEGGMHEHRPEAHRLMNDDYLWLEAWHFVHAIMEYENTEDRFVTGNVAGLVYDDHNLRESIMPANFSMFGRDKNAPLNGAKVELLDAAGNVVQKRTTDNMYNGVFVFRNVKPGNYKVRTSREGYYTETVDATVVANRVTYTDNAMVKQRPNPLAVTAYTPDVDQNALEENAVSCASRIEFTFNYDVDTKSLEEAFNITPAVEGYWEYSESYTKAAFVPSLSLELNTEYTVTIGTGAKTTDKYCAAPNLQQPLQFKFMTKGRNRLELIDQFPADGGKVHYAAPTFEFRFDKTIDATNIYNYVSITDKTGKEVTINKRNTKFNQLTNNYGNVVLAITGNLTAGEEYTVRLSGELRDRESLPLVNDVQYKFMAVDAGAEAPMQEVKADFETAAPFAYDPDQTTGITSTLPTAQRSTSVKLFGAASARFGYTFADNHGGQVVWKYTGDNIEYNTNDKIGMFVNGDFNNHELWVGVASGTNQKYTKLCDLDFLGWQYREAQLTNLEEDFCPFHLNEIKLVQKQSPITQKGYFAIDNIGYQAFDAVDDISVDTDGTSVCAGPGIVTVSGCNAGARVTIVAADGRTVAAGTPGSYSLGTGIYVVTVNGTAYKVAVK